ncbi:MAG TPA: CoB--CoM heterodisulfide reductase iron-sulfur subunit A family protein [Bacteroidales bacterium]|nr:CoB--CoM heterodisulfide reductase iron-sulfur subunit A family protein [Bacteroidales bacterium]HPS17794.1 CoB--CoM heterodisulfide reductase iron-sulfur subunit A family protein [Bacteroidales bacterium]
MKERIGVYICHCGGNISDYVDVEQLSEMMKDEDGVVIAKNVMFACADSNQKEMINDIRDKNLDSIVVASCSPKLHLHTFRGVAQRAGLNPFNYVQVNIREQCSWPHSDHPLDATKKAVGLIRAGIKRVARSKALENIVIDAKKAVVIVGAGVSGMRAAIDLAKMGNDVFLVEKDFFVGGRVAQSGELFMTNQKGKQLVEQLYNEIKSLNKITLFTGATLEKISGSLGNFNVSIKIKPRFINEKADEKLLNQAISECSVEVPDVFNYGLTRRKAIYKNYPEALPDKYVVDAEALKNEKEFLKKFSSCIDIYQPDETLTLNAGSVLVTTGVDTYQPEENEFGYKKLNGVITLPELKRLMELNPETLIYNNKKVRSVAFIYCVGNRQSKGKNKYCSRFCCTSTIHTSLQLKEKYKDVRAFHFYRDIRTYGKQEILFEKSSKQGDVYLRFDEKEPPVVEMNGNKLVVKVKDYITTKKELELETDLVVLVTGMVSRSDSSSLAEILKIPIGNDKFFNEIHPKLKPVETVIKGVFIGGSCQGPKNVSESVQSSLAASAKINALIKSGRISLDPIVATVDKDICVWCGKCAEVCEYDALKEIKAEGKNIASVNMASCTGCGICAPVCPVDAIQIAQYTNDEIESMIDGFMQKIELKEKSGEEEVQAEGAVTMKEYPQIWKQILQSINEKPKTIPEISKELEINNDLVTYHLMTMNKYSIVESAGLDKKETYHLYKQKN